MQSIKLARQMIARSRIIAAGREIRDVRRLVRTYGGTPKRWVKKASERVLVGDMAYEYHWYEHHGIGRVETKRKDFRRRAP